MGLKLALYFKIVYVKKAIWIFIGVLSALEHHGE